MRIVLDTTETFADLRMEGANHTLLRSFVARHPVTLIVPQIVVEETVNHFRESLTTELGKIKNGLRSLARLVPDVSCGSGLVEDVEAEVAKYKKHLEKQFCLVKQPTYADVPMASVVQRALARKKPFDVHGKVGFRDALLWETVLQLARDSTDEIVLITRNTHDCGSHGTLHDDLSADLNTEGLAQVKVSVCEGLNRFVDEHVKPSLQKLDDIQHQIDEGTYPKFDAVKFFDEWSDSIRYELGRQVAEIDLDRVAHRSIYSFRHPSLGRTSDAIDEFRGADVWQVNETQLGVGIDYWLSGSIECLQCSCYGPCDEDFRGDVEFTLLMTVIIEQDSGEVVSWELNEIEAKATSDWGFPDYDD